MANPPGPELAEEAAPKVTAGSVSLVAKALQALLKQGRQARLYAGGDAQTTAGRFQKMYLSSMVEALNESPVIMLDVTPDAIYCGDGIVLESTEKKGDLVETLFAEGVRGISIEAGVTDDELQQFAVILGTPWLDLAADAKDLETTIFEADFAHVFFEVIERLGDHEDANAGDSPLLRELSGLIAEINSRSTDDNAARIRQDEFAMMLRLKDTLGPENVEGVELRASISTALAAEVDSCRAGRDLDRIDVGRMVTTCITAAADPQRGAMMAGALFHYVISAMEAAEGPVPVMHNAVELLDPEFTPDLPNRAMIATAAQSLGEEPLRGRIARLLRQKGEATFRGGAFSLFSVVSTPDALVGLAGALPGWATRILADTVLLREGVDERTVVDAIKKRLQSPAAGSVTLGLAMAARVEDPRLIEPIMAHAEHPDDAVRETALVALRKHHTPRIAEHVRSRVDDPSEVVRLEALRHAVAYRDVKIGAWLQTKLAEDALAARSETELRAWCIAVARIVREPMEATMTGWALGTRATHHPAQARLALHGLKALGTPDSRMALERVASEVPALRNEALALLRPDAR